MKIIKILIIFLTLYITVASNMFSELKLDLGIENLLIKKYFIEEVINYTNGTINSIVQQETIETNREKFLKSTISIEKTVFDENMNIGIEIGILSSISENKNTWYNPQKTNNFNGEIIKNNASGNWYNSFSNGYTFKYVENPLFYLIPIIGKINYTIDTFRKIKTIFNTKYGLYFTKLSLKRESEKLFMEDSNPYKVGDTIRKRKKETKFDITSGGEMSVGLLYLLGKNISFELNGSVNYIVPIILYPDTVLNYKNGYEIGGFGYGAGISLGTI